MDTRRTSLIGKTNEDYMTIELSKTEAKTLACVLQRVLDKEDETKAERGKLIELVMNTVSGFFGLSLKELIYGRPKKERIYCIRLISFILKKEFNVHPSDIGSALLLNRTSIIHHIKYYSKKNVGGAHQELYDAIMKLIISENDR